MFIQCLRVSKFQAPAHLYSSVLLPEGRKKAGQDADEMTCFKLYLALLVWRKPGSQYFSWKE